MAVTFCCKWDSIRNGTIDPCGADDQVPSHTGEIIDTSDPKFGSGSLRAKDSISTIGMSWSNISPINPFPINSGTMGIWVKSLGPSEDQGILGTVIIKGDGTIVNKTLMYFDAIEKGWSPSQDKLILVLVMHDKNAAKIINISYANDPVNDPFTIDNAWHYLELNWLWGTPFGISELSWDGEVKIASNLGDSAYRDADINYVHVDGRTHDPFTDRDLIIMDDLVIHNERKHVGDFSTLPRLQCRCLPKQFLNLGAPFTAMNRMGR